MDTYGHLFPDAEDLGRGAIDAMFAVALTEQGRNQQLALSLRRRSKAQKGVSRPVGRVLCARLRGPAAIHLGLPLPTASCGLPASIGRAALERSRRPVSCGTSPFDLAPGGVYRAAAVTCGAGGLLHHRFTLTPRCGAVCFLWHYPAGHPGSALPTTLPCGARTFLTGPEARRDRPADSPAVQDTPTGLRFDHCQGMGQGGGRNGPRRGSRNGSGKRIVRPGAD
jgi:hypothetical protein